MKTWANVNALYQIYPRSFKDSNGDGIGDLRGIIDYFDHVRSKHHSLGIDAVWISPFYTSPMVDMGYDVSNYTDVDPIFGTLADFKELVQKAHNRGIKVVIDYVPNHTSSEHPWFKQAIGDPKSPKRDYYIWRKPAPNGAAPNNWVSLFGGSAWEFDPLSGEYYLHSFFKQQPDLNWENPAVREEMKNVLRFWLDLGVDGFRMDAVNHMAKDLEWRDEPLREGGVEGTYDGHVRKYSKYGPQLVPYLRELGEVIEEYPDRIMFFESIVDGSIGPIAEQYRMLYDVNPRIGVPFNFGGMWLPWGAESYGDYIREFQGMLKPGEIAGYCFSNHDQPRIASRFGKEQARIIAMLLLTLPGIPTVYYGDEIGMENVPVDPSQRTDMSAQSGVFGGRDPFRTPMQWDSSKNAGFSTHEPWLPVAKNYKRANVANERRHDGSFLTLYRHLLAIRNHDETMKRGDYRELLIDEAKNVLVYERTYESSTYIVALNFSNKQRHVTLPYDAHHVILTTNPVKQPKTHTHGRITLRPYEGAIIFV